MVTFFVDPKGGSDKHALDSLKLEPPIAWGAEPTEAFWTLQWALVEVLSLPAKKFPGPHTLHLMPGTFRLFHEGTGALNGKLVPILVDHSEGYDDLGKVTKTQQGLNWISAMPDDDPFLGAHWLRDGKRISADVLLLERMLARGVIPRNVVTLRTNPPPGFPTAEKWFELSKEDPDAFYTPHFFTQPRDTSCIGLTITCDPAQPAIIDGQDVPFVHAFTFTNASNLTIENLTFTRLACGVFLSEAAGSLDPTTGMFTAPLLFEGLTFRNLTFLDCCNWLGNGVWIQTFIDENGAPRPVPRLANEHGMMFFSARSRNILVDKCKFINIGLFTSSDDANMAALNKFTLTSPEGSTRSFVVGEKGPLIPSVVIPHLANHFHGIYSWGATLTVSNCTFGGIFQGFAIKLDGVDQLSVPEPIPDPWKAKVLDCTFLPGTSPVVPGCIAIIVTGHLGTEGVEFKPLPVHGIDFTSNRFSAPLFAPPASSPFLAGLATAVWHNGGYFKATVVTGTLNPLAGQDDQDAILGLKLSAVKHDLPTAMSFTKNLVLGLLDSAPALLFVQPRDAGVLLQGEASRALDDSKILGTSPLPAIQHKAIVQVEVALQWKDQAGDYGFLTNAKGVDVTPTTKDNRVAGLQFVQDDTEPSSAKWQVVSVPVPNPLAQTQMADVGMQGVLALVGKISFST